MNMRDIATNATPVAEASGLYLKVDPDGMVTLLEIESDKFWQHHGPAAAMLEYCSARSSEDRSSDFSSVGVQLIGLLAEHGIDIDGEYIAADEVTSQCMHINDHTTVVDREANYSTVRETPVRKLPPRPDPPYVREFAHLSRRSGRRCNA